jgi:hypothetical protein
MALTFRFDLHNLSDDRPSRSAYRCSAYEVLDCVKIVTNFFNIPQFDRSRQSHFSGFEGMNF